MTDIADTQPVDEAALENFRERFGALKAQLHRRIVGQDDIIDFTLMAMVAGGHVLLEGVPGLGKTLLVRTIAEALELSFKRVQFTPDLMPADLIGTKMLLEDEGGHTHIEFVPGPVFCNLLLADEINRATPKTQSALLEAMQEHSVTVAGETMALAEPYFVLATQNPLEQEGTYPLPEAQLDRFFFKLNVKYPLFEEFESIMDLTTAGEPQHVEKAFDGRELLRMRALARQVPVAPTVRKRAVELVMGTHPETEYATELVRRYCRFGASPRAGQAMLLTGKLRALLQGRAHVATEDLLAIAVPVLNHRVILNFEAQADGVTTDRIIEDVMRAKERDWRKAGAA